MTKVLVVGGNGFLGSHLVDFLAQEGHEVTSFDRYSNGVQRHTHPAVRVRVGEFLNNEDLQTAVKGQEEVFHFLSATTPITAQHDPTIDIRVNVTQSIALFSACAKAGVRRINFASSGGAIYGRSNSARQREDDVPHPRSPYAIGKLTLEHYLDFFNLEFGIDYKVMRISNPYGRRQNPAKLQGLIPIVLRKILNAEPVIQYGDGSMVRDYIHTDDLMRQILTLTSGISKHKIYNLGSGVGHTVSEVIETIQLVTGVKAQVEFRPVPPSFVNSVVLDTSRFNNEFGIFENITLREGIRDLYDFVR